MAEPAVLGYVECVNTACPESGVPKVITDDFLIGVTLNCGACQQACTPDPSEPNGPPA